MTLRKSHYLTPEDRLDLDDMCGAVLRGSIGAANLMYMLGHDGATVTHGPPSRFIRAYPPAFVNGARFPFTERPLAGLAISRDGQPYP